VEVSFASPLFTSIDPPPAGRSPPPQGGALFLSFSPCGAFSLGQGDLFPHTPETKIYFFSASNLFFFLFFGRSFPTSQHTPDTEGRSLCFFSFFQGRLHIKRFVPPSSCLYFWEDPRYVPFPLLDCRSPRCKEFPGQPLPLQLGRFFFFLSVLPSRSRVSAGLYLISLRACFPAVTEPFFRWSRFLFFLERVVPRLFFARKSFFFSREGGPPLP